MGCEWIILMKCVGRVVTGGIPLGIDLGWSLGRGRGLKEMFEKEERDCKKIPLGLSSLKVEYCSVGGRG